LEPLTINWYSAATNIEVYFVQNIKYWDVERKSGKNMLSKFENKKILILSS